MVRFPISGWGDFSLLQKVWRGFWGPPNLHIQVVLGFISCRLKRQDHEVNQSHPSIAEVKNKWSYISNPSTGENLYLTFPLRLSLFLLFFYCAMKKAKGEVS